MADQAKNNTMCYTTDTLLQGNTSDPTDTPITSKSPQQLVNRTNWGTKTTTLLKSIYTDTLHNLHSITRLNGRSLNQYNNLQLLICQNTTIKPTKIHLIQGSSIPPSNGYLSKTSLLCQKEIIGFKLDQGSTLLANSFLLPACLLASPPVSLSIPS